MSENNKYHTTFKKILLDASSNKNNYSEAIKEWVYLGESFNEESHCICGHFIVENCIIHNTLTKATLIAGNCCINKLGVVRKPANKSKKNYLELCFVNAKTQKERTFVNSIISKSEEYKTLKLSPRQVLWLEKLAGIKYRWKWYWDEESLLEYKR